MRALEVSVSGLNLAPESVHLAAELAALEPALKDDDRIALIVLILISLVALQEGSTRFPVAGPLSRAPMRRVLGSLCANGFGDDAIDYDRRFDRRPYTFRIAHQLLLAGGRMNTNPYYISRLT